MIAAPVDGRSESPDQRRRRLWIEFGVVVCLAVVPDLCYALVPYEPEAQRSVVTDAVVLLARSIGVSVPVLYIMWRSGDRWSRFGFVRWRSRVDFPLTGLVVAVPIIMALAWGAMGFGWSATPIDLADPGPAATAGLRALQAAAHSANGFAEEVVIWGFLFTRLRELLGRAGPAIIASAILFASYHLYQGLYGALGVLLFGLVHGVVFARTRRIWPLVVAHALHNIWIDWSTPFLDGYAL